MAAPVGGSRYGTASRSVRAAAAGDAARAIAAGGEAVSDHEVARRISRRHSMPHAVARQYSSDGAALSPRELGKAMTALGVPLTSHEARGIVARFPGRAAGDGAATANLSAYLSSLGLRGGHEAEHAAAAAASGGARMRLSDTHATHLHGGSGLPGSSRFLAFDSDGVIVAPTGLRADRAVRARPHRSRTLSPRMPTHRARHDTVAFEGGAVVSTAAVSALGRAPKAGPVDGHLAVGGLASWLAAEGPHEEARDGPGATITGGGVRRVSPPAAGAAGRRSNISVASPPELVSAHGGGGPRQSNPADTYMNADFSWRDAVEATVVRAKRHFSEGAAAAAGDSMGSLLMSSVPPAGGAPGPASPLRKVERSVAVAALAGDAAVSPTQRAPPARMVGAPLEPLLLSPSRGRNGAAAGMFSRTYARPGAAREAASAANAGPTSLFSTGMQGAGTRNPVTLRNLATAATYTAATPRTVSYTARLAEQVRRMVRAHLPAGNYAAGAALTAFLARHDGDGDGVIRDVDLWTRLRTLAPDITTEDVATVVTCLGAPVADATGAAAAAAGRGPAGAAVGVHTSERDVSIEQFTDWVLRGVRPVPVHATAGAVAPAPGTEAADGRPAWSAAASGCGDSVTEGEDRGGGGEGGGDGGEDGYVDDGGGLTSAFGARHNGFRADTMVATSPMAPAAAGVPDASPSFASIHARRRLLRDAPQQYMVHDSPSRPAMTQRLSWTSAAARFSAFRAGWEAKWGAPATKELAADASRVPEGTTWTTAAPAPFKILHLAAAAPPPMSPLHAPSADVAPSLSA